MALRIRAMVRARNYPRRQPQGMVPKNVSTPQQLAGSTISQTTNGNVRLAPGLAFQYDANGKPIGIVRINQGGAGIPQGQGITYNAQGQPSMGGFPASSGSGGSGGGSTPPTTSSNTSGPSVFGDSLYNQTTGLEGILGSIPTSVNNQNFRDEQYLIGIGYTPEQAKAAVQSRDYGIVDPAHANDPNAPKITRDVGSLQPGALDWNQVDVSNPYSRAGMLVKSYRGAVQGTATGMAAGGHGRSGAALTAQQGNSFNFGSGQNLINQDLTGYVARSNEDRLGIGYNANQGILRAASDYMARLPDVPTIESPEGNRTSVPATGSFILGNQAGNGLPSYNEWVSQYFKGGEARPTLPNGWSVEIKDGKIVRFIPPGGA